MNALYAARNLFENEEYATHVRLFSNGIVEAYSSELEEHALDSIQSSTMGEEWRWDRENWAALKAAIQNLENGTNGISN